MRAIFKKKEKEGKIFENWAEKKCSLMRANITRMKQLEYALYKVYPPYSRQKVNPDSATSHEILKNIYPAVKGLKKRLNGAC